LLAALAPHLRAGALVTDVGSVKRSIVAKAEALGLAARFAGSHPLAGTHHRGFEASRADLFVGAVVYVTPAAGGEEAAREIAHFWETVAGAHAVMLDAERHDAQLAVTSHVPQVVASLLGVYLAREAPPGAGLGPGARDTTRLAASDAGLWTEILLLNRDVLLPALRALEEPMGEGERARAGAAPDARRRVGGGRRGGRDGAGGPTLQAGRIPGRRQLGHHRAPEAGPASGAAVPGAAHGRCVAAATADAARDRALAGDGGAY